MYSVVWPGNSTTLPGLWRKATEKKLKIGVPAKKGFRELANNDWNPLTNKQGGGFCIEVFDMVVKSLPYDLQYEYVFYDEMHTYDGLIYQVYLQV